MELHPGERVFSHYRVERFLSQGGMGRVYLGRHQRLDRPVVLKLLAVDDDLSASARANLHARFEREARLMTLVSHPNVVAILDYGILADQTPCIVMDYVEGETVDAWRKRKRSIPWPLAVQVTLAVLAGIQALHAAGVLHRDLKPSNVVVPPESPERACLIDFGIAQPIHGLRDGLTSGMRLGTPEYMAPEQILGLRLGRAVDLYAVGVLLYELVAGALPFPGRTDADLRRRLTDDAPPLTVPADRPRPPAALATVLSELLRRDPTERPTSARAIRSRLGKLLHGSVEGVDDVLATTPVEPEVEWLDDDPFPRGVTGTEGADASPELLCAIVATRLPRGLLAIPPERRRLAGLIGPAGRGYVLPGETWVAALEAREDTELDEAVGRIVEGLRRRFGPSLPMVSRPVPGDFALTSAQVKGTSPLPPLLSEVLATLGKAAR